MTVKNVMTKNPISVQKNTLAAKALSLMNEKKITSLCVFNKNKKTTIGDNPRSYDTGGKYKLMSKQLKIQLGIFVLIVVLFSYFYYSVSKRR